MSAVARTAAAAAPRGPAGYLVEFETVDGLLQAAARVREAGFTRWDAHSPFPVHGIDEAMGIKGTRLPFIVLGGGITGCVGAFTMIWWMNAHNYPYIISGKPLNSIPSYIPIMFELTVLLSAFAAVFGMLGLNLLPELWHVVFSSRRFRRATTDRLFISIEARDPMFHPEETRRFLESLGGVQVEPLEE
jgi:hypothetical protein